MTMNATLHSGIWHSNMKLKFLQPIQPILEPTDQRIAVAIKQKY